MITFDFKSFPQMETDRLILRAIRADDVNEIFAVRSDADTLQYIDRAPHQTPEESKAWIEKITLGIKDAKWVQWAIVPRGQDLLIGTACLWNLRPETAEAELGYDMLPAYWGRGYMQEVVSAVIRYAFDELAVEMLDAYTKPANTSSVKLLERNGFNKIGKDPDSDNAIFVLRRS